MKKVSQVLHDVKSITTINEWQLHFYRGGVRSLTEDMIKQAIRG